MNREPPSSSSQSQQQHQQRSHLQQPQQTQSAPPMFDFSKIPNPSATEPRPRRRSTNTCPLTISNLTVDGCADFSIRSGGSTTASSNGSNMSNGVNQQQQQHQGGTMTSGGVRSGMANDVYPGGSEHHGGGSASFPVAPLASRRSSLGDVMMASMPAESPDPLSATARWCHASPPSSLMSGPMMATLGEVATDSGSDGDQPPQQPQQQQQQQYQGNIIGVKSEGVQSNNSEATSNLYMPHRHHHPKQMQVGDQILVPTKTTDEPQRHDSSSSSHSNSSHLHHHHPAQPRRSSFSAPEHPLHATIVFVDLEGYSKSSDVHQRHLTCDFMNTVRNLLTFAYGEIPVRGNIDNYVILPTGDGAAVIVIRPPRREIRMDGDASDMNWTGEDDLGGKSKCAECNNSSKKKKERNLPHGTACQHCSSQSLRTTEETALWIGSSLLLWASRLHIGLRVGLNSGELSIVEDPYGDPNVCGDAINMAARIMDTALPGQILASASTVIPQLNVVLAEELAAADFMIGAYEDDADMDMLDVSERDVLDAPHHVQYNTRNTKKKQDCVHCPRIKYEIAKEASEVVVKHGVTTNVQSITCLLHPLPRPEDLPPELQDGPPPMMMTHATLPTAQETDSSTAGSSGEVAHQHPMLKLRKNPLKQSFASLSSLQPCGSNHSLRGSMKQRGSNQTSKGSSNTDKPGRNNSWKLGGDSPKPSWKLSETSSSPNALTRMSMLSQLSNDDNNNNVHSSFKTLNASNTTAHMQQQVVEDEQAVSTAHMQQQVVEDQQASVSTVPQHVGNHRTPATKWYMKIKPTEMQSSSNNQIKPKVLPQELIRRHQRIAFLGIMHDNLSKGFIKILENDPSHRWDQVYVLFPSDSCLENHLAKNYRDQPVEKLIANKQDSRKTLLKLLSPVVRDLQFLQYDQLMHCGSYWDWKDPGGFIHVSPLTWGANPKTCPAMNYYWNSRVPSPEYRVYREGLEYLLGTAIPFVDDAVVETIDEDGTLQ